MIVPLLGNFPQGRSLVYMYKISILIHMRTTLNLDDQLIEKAAKLTGVKEKTALVHLGLEALISQASALRLAKLGDRNNISNCTLDGDYLRNHDPRGHIDLGRSFEKSQYPSYLPSLRKLSSTHPHVIGELACGRIKNRLEIFALLQTLPEPQVAEHQEVMHLVELKKLFGEGLGWVGMNLLASAKLTGCKL